MSDSSRRPVGHEMYDVWEVGEAYELYMGRWSRQVARTFLRWLAVPAGSTWLDVGCGTGVLSRTILDHAGPSFVRGIDQAAGFISFAKESTKDSRALFEVAVAGTGALVSETHDAVVSGLVLNFLPDPAQALEEMKRVTNPGGVIAAYVWDYAEKMDLLRYFWDAAVATDPLAATLDEGKRFPLCNASSLRTLFAAAGLRNVEVRPIDVRTQFLDFSDYWSPFLSGQGPAPGYVASLDTVQRFRLREKLRGSLPASSQGTIDIVARAWGVKGET